MDIKERLFDDTRNLSHTRGVSLLDVCRLCAYIKLEPGFRITATSLARKAKECGLRVFRESRNANSTGIRHFWYTLQKLNLVTTSHKNSITTFELTHYGLDLAEITLQQSMAYSLDDISVEEASQDLRMTFIEILAQSAYVRSIWLSLFRDDIDFTYEQLFEKNYPLVIELVNPGYRVDLTKFGYNWDDSGYRLYPHEHSVFRRLTVASRENHDFATDPNLGLIISDTARKEIVEGLRRWTFMELGLTNESPMEIDADLAELVQKKREIWIVRRFLPPDSHTIKHVAEIVREFIQSIGNGRRIRVPDLLVEFSRQESISLTNAKSLLRQLHASYSRHFYFEGASEDVIIDEFNLANNRFNYHINIDGIWRPTILLLD